MVAADRDEALAALDALANDQDHPALHRGETTTPARLAFLFTGQGSQHPGMGRELHTNHPEFATAFDTACAALDPHLDHPLRDIVFAHEGTPHAALLHQTRYTQPALFALQTALHHLLHTWGITPHYLAGHSIGEIAAAHAAGILTLQDAATLVTTRGRLMQALPTGGAMTAIQATEEEILPLLNEHVSIAAINSTTSLVIAGDEPHVQHIADTLATQGRRTKRLTTSHAFHSPHMDPILDEFHRTATQLTYHTPQIPLITNNGDPTTPEYWTHHIRRTVRYHDTVHTLHTHGTTHHLELGPHPTLTPHTPNTTPLLHHNHPETHTLLTALATTHTHGHTPTPPTTTHTHPNLPTYPFQR
ncbi:acyltransferase domain-containing protein, partial [Kitasatospora sp. NPDC059722]|uniref:acyltransferase domain-containing protein n=1 Tax=unclassified Kitasatospora TaxID=2633591 RepID=UPI0036995CA8